MALKKTPSMPFLKRQDLGSAVQNLLNGTLQKFLISKDGEVVNRFSPQVEPMEIESNILELL